MKNVGDFKNLRHLNPKKQINPLDDILNYLIAEQPEYANIVIPADTDGKRRLMRSLLNVRQPKPVSDEFLKAQDMELKTQCDEKGIVRMDDIPSCVSDGRLKLWQGDITRLKVDAIVNAANAAILGCFVPLHRCIDNAIHSAAGVQLRLECSKLMQRQGRQEQTGKAKITQGYNLPAKHVIHTVGPIIGDGVVTKQAEQQLADCYRSCLKLADDNGVRSIAFCCISTGEFKFPNQRAAEIAVATVTEYLNQTAATGIETVLFNVFKDNDFTIYQRLL